MSEEPKHVLGGPRRRLHGGLLAAVLLGGLLAVVLVGAWSSKSEAVPGIFGRSHGHEPFDPERARERVEFASEWVLRSIDASEDQKERVKTVFNAAILDLAPVVEQFRNGREGMLKELAQPTIDRGALEELRKSQMELADEASRRLVQTIADAADVLTYEQRAELIELARRFHR